MRFLNRLRRRPHKTACEALTRSGRPCKAAPLEGKPWCSLHEPGGALRLASRRWSQAQESELDSTHSPGQPRELSRRPPDVTPERLYSESPTGEHPPKTTRSTDDVLREIDAAYPRPKPKPSVPDLFEDFPRQENELTSDYWLRRQLHQQEVWRAKQAKNGAELPVMPRFIPNPEQWYA